MLCCVCCALYLVPSLLGDFLHFKDIIFALFCATKFVPLCINGPSKQFLNFFEVKVISFKRILRLDYYMDSEARVLLILSLQARALLSITSRLFRPSTTISRLFTLLMKNSIWSQLEGFEF
jgi:hypothetical protein